MNEALRVAAVQFRAGAEVTDNVAAIGALTERAAHQRARLAVFGEAAMSPFGRPPAAVAEPLNGPFVAALRDLAARHRLWLVAGMFEPADDGRVHNTVVATDGEELVAYRKRHLFDAFETRESDTIAPGTQAAPIVEIDGVSVGLSTCYDVRFADQFAELGRRGARVVCLPASWAGGPGKVDQWRLLVRSRAMDAQAFVVGVDQAGDDRTEAGEPTRHPTGVGHSLVADPLGAVVAELGPSPGMLVVDLPVARVDAVRARVPVLG